MTRPQLMIWFEKTLKREYQEKQSKIKADWSRTANMLSMIHNTSMGAKKSLKPKDVMPEFESFEESMGQQKNDTEELFEKAKKKGLKTPSKRKI